jgi:hypothetical protein
MNDLFEATVALDPDDRRDLSDELLKLAEGLPSSSFWAPVVKVLAEYLVGYANDQAVREAVTELSVSDRRGLARWAYDHPGLEDKTPEVSDWWHIAAAWFAGSADERADLDRLEDDAESPFDVIEDTEGNRPHPSERRSEPPDSP